MIILAKRTSISLDEAGVAALNQIPAYQRSKVIRDLLVARDPESVQVVGLKARLAVLNDKTGWTRTLLTISKQLTELEENNCAGVPYGVRAERARALALKALLLDEEIDCSATKEAINRATGIYARYTGKELEVKELGRELAELLHEKHKHKGNGKGKK